MLATGGTLDATIRLLKDAGCKSIRGLFLCAAPEGINRILADHPDVDIYTAAVDERLNDIGYIIPGLGDAGGQNLRHQVGRRHASQRAFFCSVY